MSGSRCKPSKNLFYFFNGVKSSWIFYLFLHFLTTNCSHWAFVVVVVAVVVDDDCDDDMTMILLL